jgi:hypothetical protein
MLERPDLADETIGHCLHEYYGLVAQAIPFLPIGYDATAWVFRVEAADHASYSRPVLVAIARSHRNQEFS